LKDYAALAEQYANDVVAGDIPAAKWTRLACKRSIRDAKRKKWKYYFDAEAANRVCSILEKFRHIKGEWANRGEKIKLEPWQCWVACQVFGWKNLETDLRRYRTVYIEVPRKNAKSTFSSAVGLYMLTADGEQGAEVYSAAKAKKQALIVFEDAQSMARRDADFRGIFGAKVGAHAIYVPHTASKFEAVASEADALEGRNPHLGIIDEVHTHPTRKVWDVFAQARGARAQPLLWGITTAGDNKYGICYEQHQYLKRILDQTIDDESYFGCIWTVDDEDDWTSDEAHRKANPNYGVSVSPDDLRSLCDEANRSSPAAKANFKTKRLNIWVDEANGLYDSQAWAKCGDDALQIEDFEGEDCYIGIDLASREDFACVAYEFRRKVGGAQHYYTFVDHYLPASKVQASENLSYRAWEAEKWITETEGETTDFYRILDDVLDSLNHYQVRLIAVDPWQSVQFMQGLERAGAKDRVLEFRQRLSTLSEPTKDLMALHREGRIHHEGDPVLAWMVGNTVGRFDYAGNVRPEKEREENKIDGVVALTMAHGALIRDGQEQTASVYVSRGLRAV
jgi:phage terminase large subunit-like protein